MYTNIYIDGWDEYALILHITFLLQIEVDLVFKILRETTDKVLQVLVALIPKVQAEDWTDTIKEHQV